MSIPYIANRHGKLALHTHAFRQFDPWQRVAVCAVLIINVLLGALLIYFQPGTRTFTQTDQTPVNAMVSPVPALPPGIDTYYYWGQHRPLDQQP